MSEPAPGDHLVSSRGFYSHHGLSIGDGQVIHYAGLANGWQPGCIEQVSLADFAAGQGFHIKQYVRRIYSPDESVARARTRLGEGFYCVFANNCEHFVRWFIDGDHHSFQVVNGSYAGNLALAGLGGAAAVVGIAEVGVVAGLSASGIMSNLAGVGAWVGGGAVAGLGVVSAVPGIVSAEVLNFTLLKDNEGLQADERTARQVGRIATRVGALGATAGGIAAVGAMGTVAGFSGAGIASGLAAIGSATGMGAALSAIGVAGSMMVGGVVVTVAAPALAAAAVGWGTYKITEWINGGKKRDGA